MDTHSRPQLNRAQLHHPHCSVGTLCCGKKVPPHPGPRRLSWHGVPPPSCLLSDNLPISRPRESSVSHETLPDTWFTVSFPSHSLFTTELFFYFFLHYLPCFIYFLFKKSDFYIKQLTYYLLIRKFGKT